MKIILISLDTLRARRLSCYGYKLQTSPYIDHIASEGVLFENAFAADIPTEVAHTGVFTGKVGLTTGIVSHGSIISKLPKTIEWLPNILKDAGFTTAAVDNLYQLQEWFARGYRYYINSSGEKRWIDGRSINDLAKPWIKAHKKEDFFLFLHYWDPHTPYVPPKDYIPLFYDISKDPFNTDNHSMDEIYNHPAYPFLKSYQYDHIGPVTDVEYIKALYDSEIRYLDDLLKELDEFLIEEGIQEDTFLILFGDHGESLTEHNIYWDHCGLYDMTVHVPIIMRWPTKIPSGLRVRGLVQQTDLMPTILEALELKIPSDLDGRTLWPTINGNIDQTHSMIYLSECASQASRGIRTSHFKYMQTYESGLFYRPQEELYDLRKDPDEKENLALTMQELTRTFSLMLDEWVKSKLNGKEDPMQIILRNELLPMRRRLEKVLQGYGLTFNEWMQNPNRSRINRYLYLASHKFK